MEWLRKEIRIAKQGEASSGKLTWGRFSIVAVLFFSLVFD